MSAPPVPGLLNERSYNGTPVPLITCVATGNPTGSEYYNEPLDPAVLDRFAVQLRCDGLIGGLVTGGSWMNASRVRRRLRKRGLGVSSPVCVPSGSGRTRGTNRTAVAVVRAAVAVTGAR